MSTDYYENIAENVCLGTNFKAT